MTASHINPNFPLIDLHRHLDGSVRLETILDLGQTYGLPLPAQDIESLRPYVQITDAQPGVMAFLSRFEWMTKILVNEDACYRVARECVEDLAKEGIDYAELRFSPWFMAEPHHLNPVAVIDAVVDGARSASRETGIPINLIGILSRTYGPEICHLELAAILSRREAFVAVDLAGDEANFPAEWYQSHFELVRNAGLHVTVHAGESAGSHSIWQAIQLLGAERIGHAVQAPKDETLLDFLAKKRIGVEVNLTSNVQTSTVKSYADHPVRLFLDRGICATLNTDDPGISAITLPYEYNVAAPLSGLSHEQIWQLQQNALEASFLTPQEKSELVLKKGSSNFHGKV
ncbi:MAG: adenosine deaminase [Bellilinea sp.]|nr:MAG: adenosine deaminase [Bellilinea sp.]